MRRKSSREQSGAVKVVYTCKPVSGWGGLIAIGRFFDGIGLRKWLAQALPDGRVSNNQVPVVDMVMQLFATILTGGGRFDHVERVRVDPTVRQLLRVNRFGSASSLTRYLGNFQQSQTEHLQTILSRAIMKLLHQVEGIDVLDLDSTVFTRFGDQQGSSKGYNPHRKGAKSHHPLLGMLARSKVIVHAWLRDGSASPHRGCVEFMSELLARLPETLRIEAVRADSGFYSRKFMSFLEAQQIPYAIAAKMARPFIRWCESLGGWRQVSANRWITEGQYKAPKATCARRIVVIREVTRRELKGVLFPILKVQYHAIATSLTADALEVCNFYRQRGDCENRIKELRFDFHADGFCLRSFAGTEAAFLLNCFLFNLVSLFKALILRDRKITLGTIRHKIFVVGAVVGSCGRRTILRLGLVGPWRREFEHLLGRVSAWASTAAQSNQILLDQHLEQPSRWRLRTAPALFY